MKFGFAPLMLILCALWGCGRSGNAPPPPVTGVEWDRYLGTWYEIARYDHRFERGLVAITATYERRADGNVSVVNRGFHPERDRWSESSAKAYGFDDQGTGSIQVQFFWPFSGEYRILALDEDYEWALVGSSSRSYLWILSRDPQLDPAVQEAILTQMTEFGYASESLIWVDQSLNMNKDNS